MAGLIPSGGGFEPTLTDRLTFSVGNITNGETITLPMNRQMLTGPIDVQDGAIEFREGSSIHFLK